MIAKCSTLSINNVIDTLKEVAAFLSIHDAIVALAIGDYNTSLLLMATDAWEGSCRRHISSD